MDDFNEKIDSLLAKQLAGECTPEEAEQIRQWLDKSPENRQYLSDLVWLWERSEIGLDTAPRAVDTEAALHRVKNKLRGGARIVPIGQYRRFWLQAAAVLLLAVAAVYWWQTANTPAPIQIIASKEILSDTLVDGSVVTLQQYSGLTIKSDFNRSQRRIQLKGEAYFQVAPDTDRPSVVEVQELEVQVVGTAFTVDNFSDENKVIVTVTEGKVQVRLKDQMLLLSAGEQATFDRSTTMLKRTSPAQGTPVFKNRIFRFDATPLRAVIQQISKSYGVEISIKNKQLENCPLTARYNNLPLERVLNLVSESFSIEFEKSENGYLLIGDACE